ncbi:MAG: hypothetical protein AMJ77_07160 [Dehalococcoidia bacterium SM23_28_2]|nr:MAG: hypothetical protein AMJ77_07160 [Dehalococcoidia bacterium SM23_28_2]
MTMPVEETEALLKQAEKELDGAKTADDIRQAWRKYYLQVGHRNLGRLLIGRSVDEIIARRRSRGEE